MTSALQVTLALLLLAVSAPSLAQPVTAPPTEKVPDTMEARVQACVGCHGQNGRGVENVYFPRLAGKPAGYLYNQLVAFRDGRRKYTPMNYLLAYLPDPFLRKMAEYFAGQNHPTPPPVRPGVSQEILKRGQQLTLQGDLSRQVPACIACHGPELGGREPGIPGLLGLRADYISAQLGAWRYGTRTALGPDCMQLVAAHLTEADVAAASAWLASLPVPANLRPLRQGPTALPLGCGSQIEEKPPQAQNASARRATPQVERGKYLAQAGDCIACHTIPGTRIFSGNRPMPTPFGTLYSPNITPDRETGIGKWNADEFYKMMHTGRGRDGSLLYPAMPFASYTKVTRPDSDAIFAYLKSVPPVRQANKPHELKFPFNNRSLLIGWRTLYFKEGEYQPDKTRSPDWNRGAYLVQGLGHCAMCHTPINALGGSSEAVAFEGGLIPMQNWYAPSLTSNREAGLGDWHTQDIKDLLQTGVSNRGAVYGPMAEVTYNSLQYLTEDDVRAMAVYLKSLPENDSSVADPGNAPLTADSTQMFSEGKRIYDAQCATCHAADGRGKLPHYPPLANNQSIEMKSAVNPIRMVLNGGYPPGTSKNPMPYGMPPFAQSLSDAEVASVVTYIRTAWGNRGAPVSSREANALRAATLE